MENYILGYNTKKTKILNNKSSIKIKNFPLNKKLFKKLKVI